MNDNSISKLNIQFQLNNKVYNVPIFDAKFAEGPNVKKIEVRGHQYFYEENAETPELINNLFKNLGDVKSFESEKKLASYISNTAHIDHISITNDIYSIGNWQLLGRTHADSAALKLAKNELCEKFIENCKTGDAGAILSVINQIDPPLNEPKTLFEIADRIERRGNQELANSIRDTLRPFDLKSVMSQSPRLFKEHYIDPQKGELIAEKLTSLFDSGKFKKFYDRNEFVDQLSITLRDIGNDRHLEIVDRKMLEQENPKKEVVKEVYVSKVKSKVENGIGRLELTKFDVPSDLIDGKAIALLEVNSALNQLKESNPKAIVIDLRENTGGSQYMMAHIASHFLPPDLELGCNVYRDEILPEEKRSFTTDPVKTHSENELSIEKRMLTQPIYILTSNRTLSAAEALTYHLKEHRQAIVIGEQTGGGAHISKLFDLGPDFYLGISFGDYALKSGEPNWEAKGIIPDIQVNVEKAEEVVKQQIDKNLKI